MVRNTLWPAIVLLMAASAASAGEINIFPFPTTFVPQELTDIPVLMDIGYFVLVRDQDQLQIKLLPTEIGGYEGCVDVDIEANFDLRLSCEIVSNGLVDGNYSCTVTPSTLDPPGGTTTVCAKLTDASLLGVEGGTRDVQVAVVTLKVAPR